MNMRSSSLPQYIDSLQSKGQYFLWQEDALQKLGITHANFKNSVSRLTKKGRLIFLKKGLYLIIPLEYLNMEAPPPEWYIDQLMKAYGVQYYVGLLSAAAIHEAGHQQPQTYQVLANKVLRPLQVGRARIVFYFKRNFKGLPLVQIKTPTGYMAVSSPEVTAFDLVTYLKQSGHINHVSTILEELGDRIDSTKLVEAAAHFTAPCLQRTGYLLESVGFKDKAQPLLNLVSGRYYLLRPDKEATSQDKNTKWHLYINERVETDL